jgi:hypothetical protein
MAGSSAGSRTSIRGPRLLIDRPSPFAGRATIPELVQALRRWLGSWAGIGHVAGGMARQGYDIQLTRHGEAGWRATFYPSGKEHSIVAGRPGSRRPGGPQDGSDSVPRATPNVRVASRLRVLGEVTHSGTSRVPSLRSLPTSMQNCDIAYFTQIRCYHAD